MNNLTSGTITDLVFAGAYRIGKVQNSANYYYHLDRLGSIRLVTNSLRQQTFTAKYLPYGTSYATSGTETFQYTGKTLDLTSGLYYYGYRYYDNNSGRFITPDPAGPSLQNPQSINRYSYALNNPNDYFDLNGAKWCKYGTTGGYDYYYDDVTGMIRCGGPIGHMVDWLKHALRLDSSPIISIHSLGFYGKPSLNMATVTGPGGSGITGSPSLGIIRTWETWRGEFSPDVSPEQAAQFAQDCKFPNVTPALKALPGRLGLTPAPASTSCGNPTTLLKLSNLFESQATTALHDALPIAIGAGVASAVAGSFFLGPEAAPELFLGAFEGSLIISAAKVTVFLGAATICDFLAEGMTEGYY